MTPLAFRAITCLLVCLHPPIAAAQDKAPGINAVRVFLDCGHSCDEDFLRKEITFIDWVRDRKDSDVHVLVTTQGTGGGGTEYTMKFIGLGRFAGVEQTLKHVAPQTATSDETRKGIADVLKLGLVRYVSESLFASRMKVTFSEPPADTGKLAPGKDPWNLWVFRASFGGSFNGEQSSTSRSLRGSGSANRTTDAWKVSFSVSGRYSRSTYDLGDDEPYVSVSRNSDVNGSVVKSLTQHWSLGLVANREGSTYLNYDSRIRVAPGLEYNFFPYSQSTRRMFTLQYTLGVDQHDYIEETLFGKTSETLVDHTLTTALSLRQPWGTVAGSVDFMQYLTIPDKYSLAGFGSANVRLFKGFSFNVFGNIERTRNQIYLPRGEATTEEILVRQRQLATGYRYFLNFSISYSFGSIFNNIVNPRFGGGGGEVFFFD